MKLKISLFFLFLSIILTYLVLNFDIFNKFSSINKDNIELQLSKNLFFDFLKKNDFKNYSNQQINLENSLILSADIITIHFWASWCAPCVNEVPELIEFAQRVSTKNDKNLNVVFIIVSLDENQDELLKFIKSFPDFNKDPFIRIWDYNKQFSKLVNADRLPMTIILNKKISEPRVVRGVVEWKTINF